MSTEQAGRGLAGCGRARRARRQSRTTDDAAERERKPQGAVHLPPTHPACLRLSLPACARVLAGRREVSRSEREMCGPRSRPSQPGNSSGHWLETAGGHHALRVQRGDLHNYITNKPRRGRGTSNSWGVPRLKRGALPAAPDPQKSQMGARAPF